MNKRAPDQTAVGWIPDQGDGTYRNPVIHADYSDPDVIRVGEDFYMVSSSFNHMPGLPILHSRDLVNWTIVNQVIQRLDLPGYDRVQHGKGVWAPSLRYHEGKYWVFFSTPDEGIFMSYAEDPLGIWSVPHMVHAAKGWIDPCPFWDDDGEAYLVHAFAFSRSGRKHLLQLCRMSRDGRRLLDEGTIIVDGTVKHPTLEGPKLYKRNGYYYIFAPAGGVTEGWQCVFRSDSIFGPYEDKIVLSQGTTEINGPHQGGYVELSDGESWFIHFQDKGAYGRIVHLQPMQWVEGWPVMGNVPPDQKIGEPARSFGKPNIVGETGIAIPQTSDDFRGERLGLQWQWQANPRDEWYECQPENGALRLFAWPLPEEETGLYDAPQLLMQKFPAPAFKVTTKLRAWDFSPGDRAGVVVFGQKAAALMLASESDLYALTLYESEPDGRRDIVLARVEVKVPEVYLQVEVTEPGRCVLRFSMDGSVFSDIGDPFVIDKGAWVGAKVGLAAVSAKQGKGRPYGEFTGFYFDYEQ
ncbi:glycoside hydrolase 43 family protein [Paenibacillus sp. M1]|uniref:Glycoside hydrolase 43 family protein n=1 Tax=Paenibacillus haidiansis TaxID=1574488 RepID=A0ABU7VVF0_9BACL